MYEKSLTELIGANKAKGYRRLALMGTAKNAGNYSADDLIRIAGLGLKDLTAEELRRVMEHAAGSGYAIDLERCGGRVAGLIWNGKIIQSSDKLPTGIVHYLRHVVFGKEWPEGTSLTDYLESLHDVIRDSRSGIMVSKYQGVYWQIAFIAQSGQYRGIGGSNFILVEYRDGYGFWITGFQSVDLQRQLQTYRSNVQWLRKMK